MNEKDDSQQPEAKPREVFVDFPQVGIAGPFPVEGGKVTLPDVTMNDLIQHARTGYVKQQPEARGVVDEATKRDAQRWRNLTTQCKRDYIWYHVLTEDQKEGHESLESAVDALTETRKEDYATLTAMWRADEAKYRDRAEQAEARAERLAEAGRRVTAAFRALGEATAWTRAAEQARHECEAAMLALDAALEQESNDA